MDMEFAGMDELDVLDSDNRMKDLYMNVRINSTSEIPEGVESCVIYCRVSTKQYEQEMSLKSQLQEAIRYSNEKKYFIIGFFVEKETGKSDIVREGFMGMLQCIEKFKPDKIVVKSLDRLSRSVEVDYKIIRICQKTNTKIDYMMYNKVFDPNNMDDVTFMTFEGTMHQAYSIAQHAKGIDVVNKKKKTPWLSTNNECFGYRFNKETREMEVFEPEAIYIRKIFEWYVFQGKGTTSIAKELAEQGLTGFKSNKLISETCILNWLKNESYIGKMRILKRRTEFEYGTGAHSKRIPTDKEDQPIVDVPAIVEEDVFNLAQEILADRYRLHASKRDMSGEGTRANFAGKHLFAHTVYCAECGNSMLFKYTDRKQEVGVYKCSCKKKAKRKENNISFSKDEVITCNNPYGKIRESMLTDIVTKALECYSDCEAEIYERLMAVIEKVLQKQRRQKSKDIEALAKAIKDAKKEYERIKKAYVNAVNNDIQELADDLQVDFINIKAKIETYEKEIEEKNNVSNIIFDNRFRIESARNRLIELMNFEELDHETIIRFVDRILVQNNGNIDVYLRFNQIYSGTAQNKGQSLSLCTSQKGNVENKTILPTMDHYQRGMGIQLKT